MKQTQWVCVPLITIFCLNVLKCVFQTYEKGVFSLLFKLNIFYICFTFLGPLVNSFFVILCLDVFVLFHFISFTVLEVELLLDVEFHCYFIMTCRTGVGVHSELLLIILVCWRAGKSKPFNRNVRSDTIFTSGIGLFSGIGRGD